MSLLISRSLLLFSRKTVEKTTKRLISVHHGNQIVKYKINLPITNQVIREFNYFTAHQNNLIFNANRPLYFNSLRHFASAAPEEKIPISPSSEIQHIIVKGLPFKNVVTSLNIFTLAELGFAVTFLPYVLNSGLPNVLATTKTSITIAAIALILLGPYYFYLSGSKKITEIVTHTDGTVRFNFVNGLSIKSKSFNINRLESEHMKDSKNILLKVKDSKETFLIDSRIIPPSEELIQFLSYLPKPKQSAEPEKKQEHK